MRLAVAAAACLALACGNKKEAPPSKTGGGSAAPSGSATEPTPKPALPADVVDAAGADACDDAELQKHVDAGLAAATTYQDALLRRTARWKKDCDLAMQDLTVLAPEASRLAEANVAFQTWRDTLAPACRTRVEELGKQSPITAALETRTAIIDARMKPLLDRCKDVPGLPDAAAKGLGVLRTKPAAQ